MRPAIPRQLERDVLVEAGHRCALPRCHTPTVEIAHIKPWAQVKAHTFDNLIALCPTCHARYDKGEIGFLVETDDIRYQFSTEGMLYLITPKGREFVEKWLSAQAL